MTNSERTRLLRKQKWVTIPDDIYHFLLGESALNGTWFGEKHPSRTGKFWWRHDMIVGPDIVKLLRKVAELERDRMFARSLHMPSALAVLRAAMRLYKFRVHCGSFAALIEKVRGRILLDAADRACARHERELKRRK